MRCECCDKQLSDKEATARYAPENPTDAPRYVGMCKTCQGFLPPGVKILTRFDLEDTLPDEDRIDDSSFDYEDDYGYED